MFWKNIAGDVIRTRAPTKGLAPQASAFDQALPPPRGSLLRLLQTLSELLEILLEDVHCCGHNLIAVQLAPAFNREYELVLSLLDSKMRDSFKYVIRCAFQRVLLIYRDLAILDFKHLLGIHVSKFLRICRLGFHFNDRLMPIICEPRRPFRVVFALSKYGFRLKLDLLPFKQLNNWSAWMDCLDMAIL